MDLNLLKIFLAIYEKKSVSAASVQVGLAQSSVSNALSRLRSEFGDALFIREHRGMSPTSFADAIYPDIKGAVENLLGLSDINRLQSKRANFVLTMSDVAQVVVLPLLDALFQEHSWDAYVHVKPLQMDSFERDLAHKSIHLGIAHFPELSAHLKKVKLWDECFVSLLRAGHPALESWNLEEFAKHEHILVSPGGGRESIVDHLLEQHNLKRVVRTIVPYFNVGPSLVKHSNRILTLPRNSLTKLDLSGCVVRWPPLTIPPVSINMVWHALTQTDPLFIWLRTKIREVTAGLSNAPLPFESPNNLPVI